MKVRTQGQVVKMVVILVEEEKMREMLVVVVGVVDRSPSPTLPKGRESLLAVFKDVWWRSFPLGKVGMGLLCWLVRTPGNSEPIATPYYIYTLRCIVVSMVSVMGRGDDTKSFVPFQGFALCVCVWWQIFPRAGSRISATTHRRACPVAV